MPPSNQSPPIKNLLTFSFHLSTITTGDLSIYHTTGPLRVRLTTHLKIIQVYFHGKGLAGTGNILLSAPMIKIKESMLISTVQWLTRKYGLTGNMSVNGLMATPLFSSILHHILLTERKIS